MGFEYLEIAGTILFPKNKQVKCSLISLIITINTNKIPKYLSAHHCAPINIDPNFETWPDLSSK